MSTTKRAKRTRPRSAGSSSGTSIEALPSPLALGVARVEYVSEEQAYDEFRRIFKDQPALVAATTADALPASFRITPTENADMDAINARYGSAAGVNEIATAAFRLCP